MKRRKEIHMGYWETRELRILQNILEDIEKAKDLELELSENKNLDSFVLRCPNVYIYVFWTGAIGFGGLFAIGLLYNLILAQKFEWQWIAFGSMFAIPCLILAQRMESWKLKVNKKTLKYTGFGGKTSSFTFEQVDRLAITDQKSLVLYVQGKKIGPFDKDYIGWKNLLLRCTRDGILLTADSEKPYTKGRLLFASMKTMMVVFGIFGLFLEVVVGGAALKALLFHQDVWEWIVGMLYVPGFPLFFLGCFLFLPAGGLLQIRRQEKELNMKFSQEMKEHKICGSYIPNHTWFIRVEQTHIVAFRRDYIASLREIESGRSYNSKKMKIVTISGKEIVITGSPQCLKDLENWVKHG